MRAARISRGGFFSVRRDTTSSRVSLPTCANALAAPTQMVSTTVLSVRTMTETPARHKTDAGAEVFFRPVPQRRRIANAAPRGHDRRAPRRSSRTGEPMNFASDNGAGVAPADSRSDRRLGRVNAPAYGADDFTAARRGALERSVRDARSPPFSRRHRHGRQCAGARRAGRARGRRCSATKRRTSIDDECGAPEFFTGGAKLVGIPGQGGKITPGALAETLARFPRGQVKSAQPGALSLSQATEAGRRSSARRNRRLGGDLVGPVSRPRLRRLAERQRAGLAGLRLAARIARERLGERRRLDFAVAARTPTTLAPPVKNSGAPHSSSITCASSWQNTRLPRRRQRGERQRIGGGAGGDEKNRRLALEDFAYARLGARGEIVGAVGGRIDAAGGHDRSRIGVATPAPLSLAKFIPADPRSCAQPRLSCPREGGLAIRAVAARGEKMSSGAGVRLVS